MFRFVFRFACDTLRCASHADDPLGDDPLDDDPFKNDSLGDDPFENDSLGDLHNVESCRFQKLLNGLLTGLSFEKDCRRCVGWLLKRLFNCDRMVPYDFKLV